MRLLHTFNSDRTAQTFSHFLQTKSIENNLEISSVTDWGSDEYGTLQCRIWIIDEEDLDAASKWLAAFQDNPNDAQFTENILPAPPSPAVVPAKPHIKFKTKRLTAATQKGAGQLGVLTLYLILFCTIIFFATQATKRPLETPPANIPFTPLFSSPIKKQMLYDYPLQYELTDKLVNAYGFDKLFEPQALPPEGRFLIRQIHKTPVWRGFYPEALKALSDKNPPEDAKAPLFEKIKQGQVWRLVSPIFLHADIFHLFFNMIWLLVLGVQMEKRLGMGRMGLFILLSAIFSNTAQYLMSGPDFLGFSGVLCGMIVFVWIRQKNFPWEGYHLQPSTMAFISIFVGAMAVIQLISFALQIAGQAPIAPPIANTAHLSGALSGLLMAKIPFFGWKMKH